MIRAAHVTPEGVLACKASIWPSAVEDRRAWGQALIERYCHAVSGQSGKALDVKDAYRAQACLALLMWTPTLCPSPTLPDMQPEATSLVMIKRITTAMDDHDVLAVSQLMEEASLDNNTAAYQALGEAVVQAIVLNAGLAQAKDPSVDSVSVDLVFKLRPDTAGQCLPVTHERVGEPPLQLRIAVPSLTQEC